MTDHDNIAYATTVQLRILEKELCLDACFILGSSSIIECINQSVTGFTINIYARYFQHFGLLPLAMLFSLRFMVKE